MSRRAATAIRGTKRVTGIAVAADHEILIVLLSQCDESRFHLTTAEAKDKVDGGLLLDVVVSEGPVVVQLLAGENQTLLVGRDGLLVLDLPLQILNGVGGLDVESDVLAG